ncbi:MAG: SAM-dependent methyltransferase [Ruminococcaceae bacterium]|nr:SAM-dependent methyltransferase [Oscillospiraceae bacterium]
MNLSNRLMSAAKYVRRGSKIADIGTDHAWLPIYLIEKGISPCAVAADINEGPLERARINIPRGMQKKIELRLTDGLSGIEDCGVNDILICGMGGELIARIISDAPFTKNGNIRLVLQPMTKAPHLREFLLSSGYSVIDEALSFDDRIYQTLCAEYTGKTEKYSDTELLLGRHNIERGGELFSRFVAQNIKMFEGIIAGKAAGGADISYEEKILKELRDLL